MVTRDLGNRTSEVARRTSYCTHDPYGGPDADLWELDRDGYPAWWQPGPYDAAAYPALGWDCDDLDVALTPPRGC